MDFSISYDKAFVDARRKDGTYTVGDERPRHSVCDCCRRSFVMKLGQYRDLQQNNTRPKCKACLERDARYKDIVEAAQAAAPNPDTSSPQDT